jgi:hypothetical protein
MSGILPDSGVAPSQTLNAIANPDMVGGCANLWYAPRCQPRFDPIAQNALLSEVMNAVNLAGDVYDCNRNDNLFYAVKAEVYNVLFGCLEREFPVPGAICEIVPLAIQKDINGCSKIVRFSPALANIAPITPQGLFGPADMDEEFPGDGQDTASFYNLNDLNADIANGTVNMAKANSTRFMAGNIDLPCASNIEIQFTATVRFAPLANGGAGMRSRICAIIDGAVYATSAQGILPMHYFSNFEAAINAVSPTVYLSAGQHSIQLFVVAEGDATNAAQVLVSIHNGIGNGGGYIRYSQD